MPVDVRLPTVLRSHAGGQSTVSLDGSTVADILLGLEAQFPGLAGQVLSEDGTLRKFVNIYLNDDDIRYLSELDTPVKDGDEVSIIPAVAGG